MENELNRARVQPEAPGSAIQEPPGHLELAHVLFTDLVAFSTMHMEEQRQALASLQEIVRNAPHVRDSELHRELIRLPTGDGMALVFFGNPIACIECALHIAAAIKNSGLKLRMGINTGPVYRVADINTNLNVSGGGINTAQRVMDAGDAGHVLLSKSTAEILLHLKDWAGAVHDLGEHPVKHGVILHFYNLYTADAGNPAIPSRFQAERSVSLKRRRRRIVAMVAAVLIVILGIGVAARVLTGGKRRRSVAVMGFRNITARHEADWVSTDVAEGLRTQLASTGKLRAISGEESAQMWKDLGLTELDSMGKSTLAKLRKRGADLVIVGSYTDLPGGRIHLNLVIQDTEAGETTDSLIADGTESEITQLIAQTGDRLRTKMGLGSISAEKERQLALSQPSPEAAPYYSDGLAKLRAYEPMQARDLLAKAAIIDQGFPFAHSALAEAWLVLGYDQKAKDEAKKAFQLSSNLALEDRISIEARYRGIANEWPAAITAYQQLYKYSQRNLDYGLKLAEAQRSAGKGQAGLATLAVLRKLPQPEGSDPRIDLEEAETAASLGDLKRGQTVAARAASAARSTGARLLESRSLIWSCDALRKLGDMQKGKQACEQARDIATQLQDKLGTARALNDLANMAIERKLGEKLNVASILDSLGDLLVVRGNLPAAEQQYREAASIQEGMSAKGAAATSKLGLAIVSLERNDAAAAESGARASVQEFHSEKDSSDETLARVVLARSLLAEKKLPESQKEMQAALGLLTDATQRNVRFSALTWSERLRAVSVGESNVPQALESLRKIAGDASEAGMPVFDLEARLAIGEIEAAAGNDAPARAELNAVQKEAQAKGFALIAQKAGRSDSSSIK